MPAIQWNADDYARNSCGQFGWALSVIERRQENGLLRALGLTRGQLRGLLAWEAVLVSGVAAVLGVLVGGAYGLIGSASVLGEANTSPLTATVSMPRPTYPACAGSWPAPPPVKIATFPLLRNALMSARTTVLWPASRANCGFRATSPARDCPTTEGTSLMSFFISDVLVELGRRPELALA